MKNIKSLTLVLAVVGLASHVAFATTMTCTVVEKVDPNCAIAGSLKKMGSDQLEKKMTVSCSSGKPCFYGTNSVQMNVDTITHERTAFSFLPRSYVNEEKQVFKNLLATVERSTTDEAKIVRVGDQKSSELFEGSENGITIILVDNVTTQKLIRYNFDFNSTGESYSSHVHIVCDVPPTETVKKENINDSNVKQVDADSAGSNNSQKSKNKNDGKTVR